MKLSEVITEVRAIFSAYWGATSPVYYENIPFDTSKQANAGKITSFIYLKIVQGDKNLIGITGNSAKKGFKRSNGFIYIDYFFKTNIDAVTINAAAEGIVGAMQNQILTKGETYEGKVSGIQRSGNKAFNFVRITLELNYEDIE